MDNECVDAMMYILFCDEKELEGKRYYRRFTHFKPESDYLHGILHTDLNAIIVPIVKWR